MGEKSGTLYPINRFRSLYRTEGLTDGTSVLFRSIILGYYRRHKRPMPWRNIKNRYRIFVSEVMLQQTQVDRVRPKYTEFIRRFPNFKSLAEASLREVLAAWHGLGYNRRGLYLRQAAEIIRSRYKGKLPADPAELEKLPGIGKATAASIFVFAFNKPRAFIETNIRSVYIHFFFPDEESIPDSAIMPLVEQTMDRENPRDWFYALMDYGVYLKKNLPGGNEKSAHYQKQSAFKGSDRRIRGIIIKMLLENPRMSESEVIKATGEPAERIQKILAGMGKDGLITCRKGAYYLP